jgi:two-component system, NarL family, sensor histidine kinase UhpB
MMAEQRQASFGAVGQDAARVAVDRVRGGGLARVWRSALSISLFYKILVGNTGVLLLFVLAAALIGERLAQPGYALLLVAGGVVLTAAINAAVLRLALLPLALLQETAARVSRGEREARVPSSPLSDAALRRMAETFNAILDSDAVHRERLRKVAVTALGAAEEERRRLARELHDGTAQDLAALQLQVRLARSAQDGEQRDAQLANIAATLTQLVEDIRGMAGALRPPALDMLGLAAALETMGRQVRERTDLRVHARMEPVTGLLSAEAELALYRVVQEAVTNTVRHADARSLSIELASGDGVVTAQVIDDGAGFVVDDVLQNGAIGLFGMQERASYVGGRVELSSRPGAGTRVAVTIPQVEALRNG